MMRLQSHRELRIQTGGRYPKANRTEKRTSRIAEASFSEDGAKTSQRSIREYQDY